MNPSELLSKSSRVVVLTGAGLSTASGLQDFRGTNGLWQGKDPMRLASVHALNSRYEEFMEFYNWRIEEVNKHKPNLGHQILAKWESKGIIDVTITQNVDTYHEQAGSKRVLHLHGDLSMRKDDRGRVRPNVVLFGESLPHLTLDRAFYYAHSCEVLLVLGTSLQVSPANNLVKHAYRNGAEVILINNEPTGMDEYTHLRYYSPINEVLGNIDMELSKVGI